ncbi:uncharacterized protein LOC129764918 isoform X2 [Toxorhynchites rutilus septentrionalis]|uniref:uncharacterized protein LOC129764918 isoform X2 n=1 Tax=Toxorhynchites rutilus septentrionalis TaxID=329112 RepID=UPI002479670B|nr:uncharacterized protein LOC129764918 isoform X2 [Toxorhynchites rutilus septentrionalis]
MFIIKLLSFTMIIERIVAQHDTVQSQELLTHLDYFGKAHIIGSILHDYSNVSESWTNPDFEHHDQRLIETLQSYVVETLQNETDSGPYGSGNNVKLFTNFCGPGQSDYQYFPGLPHKPQLFTRLSCSCDSKFFSCLQKVSTFFSYAVAWIYSKVQAHCFDYEYPVIECKQYVNDGLLPLTRCGRYLVDNSIQKQWQWFNVPYLHMDQMCFPEVFYRNKIFWYSFEEKPKTN